ncbi:uncharacterized protein LOC142635018 [Castanea sativa]|uniref:uncharacterized protein LOC142635018 n=1 Tax=Castanea sativa TaxID=21020 RepID=UPI003F652507
MAKMNPMWGLVWVKPRLQKVWVWISLLMEVIAWKGGIPLIKPSGCKVMELCKADLLECLTERKRLEWQSIPTSIMGNRCHWLCWGLWMLWNSERVDVMPLANTEQEIHVVVKVPNSDSNWLFFAIYASSRSVERHILWNNLIKVVELHDMPWVLAGDFNEPLTKEDKFWAWHPNPVLAEAVKTFIEDAANWNRLHFGNIFEKKKSIMAKLNGIQRAMSGDRNIAFYHVSTLVRRKRNRILAIKDLTREWIHEENEIKDFIRRGFEGVYTSSFLSSPRHNPLVSQWQAQLSEEEKMSISGAALNEEIKTTLWSLKPFKAPGPDGLHARFFQIFWLVVGKSVLEEVGKIFEERKMPKYLNKTHIALIPKIQGPETLGNYRPISLCNTVYKIVTKIIVARVRPFLDKLISLLQPAFVPGRKSVDNAIIVQEIIHTLSKKRGNIGYMALKIDLEKAYDKLKWMSEAKSRVFFSPNVDRDSRESFCDILGFHSTPSLGKYLGFPNRLTGSSSQDFNYILDRVKTKLAGWKANLLSLAGRMLLIQASSSAIPAYVMQCAQLLGRILDGIDLVNRNFLWGSSETTKKVHWVGWHKVAKSKEEGTLGLQAANGRNNALLAKLNWRFHTERDALWSQVLSIGVKGCLVRRGIGEDDCCPICQVESETILHALRDCLRVKAVWLQLGIDDQNRDF